MDFYFCTSGLKTETSAGPRTQEEALEISADQYQMLMQGLEIVARHPIEEISCPEFSL